MLPTVSPRSLRCLGSVLGLLLALPHHAAADEGLRVERVRGRVVGLDGQPLTGARVVVSTREGVAPPTSSSDGKDELLDRGDDPERTLERVRARVWGRAPRDIATGRTREDGTFDIALELTAASFSDLTASATASDGSAWGMTGVLVAEPGSHIGGIGRMVAHEIHYPSEVIDGALDVGLILARPLARIEVEVRRGGLPLSGGHVYVRRPGIGLDDQLLVEVGASCRAKVTLPAGPVRLAALPESGPSQPFLTLDARPGEQEVTLDLAPEAPAIRGRVVDADGRPVAALLRAVTETAETNGSESSLVSTRSDERGNFVLEGVPRVQLFLIAEVPGTSRRSLPVPVVPGTTLEVALTPEGSVEVEVPPGLQHIYDLRTDGVANHDGYGQELRVPKAAQLLRLDGIPLGRVQLIGDGFPSSLLATPVLTIERGQVVRTRLEGRHIQGHVVDHEGRGRSASLECRPPSGGRPWHLGVASDDGSFSATLGEGFEVRAERSGFWTSVEQVVQCSPWVRPGDDPIELRLEPPPSWATGPSKTERYLQR